MGRFRGTTVTGEIVDNRQEHMNAFAMVREGMAFLERTMPLGARFPRGTVFREDRFPVPLEALREILLNAVMHRDYSHYSGYIAIVVLDDRIEIQSCGRLPTGVTVEQLSGPHISRPVNPLIAEAFHRTGAVEVWGRGTNRVVETCQKHGTAPPVFEEKQGFLVVTFRAQLVAGAVAGASGGKSGDQVGTKSGLSREQVEVLRLCRQEQPLVAMMKLVGRRNRTKFRDGLVKPLIKAGLLELTIPDKPRSRLQRYRTTEAGLAVLGLYDE
jgi:ATP-dependent DNA helicase RecG